MLLYFSHFLPQEVVVWLRSVLELHQILEYVNDLPVLQHELGVEQFLRFLKRFKLYVADLVFFCDLLPRQRLVEKFEDDEKVGPQVIFPSELFFLVRCETGVRDCAPEVCMLTLWVDLKRIHVEVLLG